MFILIVKSFYGTCYIVYNYTPTKWQHQMRKTNSFHGFGRGYTSVPILGLTIKELIPIGYDFKWVLLKLACGMWN